MTQQQKTNHINRVVQGVAMLLRAAALCRDVNLEANQMGYASGGANALVDSDFTTAAAPCMASDYNTILATLATLDSNCATVPSGGSSIYQILRQLSR